MVTSKKVATAVRAPARKRRAPPVPPVVNEVVDDMVVQLVDLPPAPMAAASVAEIGKSKLIRDSFTMPKNEYQTIDLLKTRLLRLSHSAKKSELLRAGVAALARMSDEHLLLAARGVPSLKTGRPKTGKDERVEKDEKVEKAGAPKKKGATA